MAEISEAQQTSQGSYVWEKIANFLGDDSRSFANYRGIKIDDDKVTVHIARGITGDAAGDLPEKLQSKGIKANYSESEPDSRLYPPKRILSVVFDKNDFEKLKMEALLSERKNLDKSNIAEYDAQAKEVLAPDSYAKYQVTAQGLGGIPNSNHSDNITPQKPPTQMAEIEAFAQKKAMIVKYLKEEVDISTTFEGASQRQGILAKILDAIANNFGNKAKSELSQESHKNTSITLSNDDMKSITKDVPENKKEQAAGFVNGILEKSEKVKLEKEPQDKVSLGSLMSINFAGIARSNSYRTA